MKNSYTLLCVALLFVYSSFSQIASDYCSTATNISSLDSVYGTTLLTYTATVSASDTTDEDDAPLTNVFCGSMENNGWFEFTAVDSMLSFDVIVTNCVNGDGIQMEIFYTSDCYNFTSVSNCENTGVMTDFTMVANNLVPGTNYYIMVDGQAGDVCDYNFNPGLSRKQIEKANRYFKLFPNPAKEYVNIEIFEIQPFTVEIRDLIGRKVLEKLLNKGNNSLELSGIKQGYYFVILKSDGFFFSEKIQIVH